MIPLLAQAPAEPGGPSLGGILLGVLVLGLMAWLGARLIVRRPRPPDAGDEPPP